MERHGFTRRHFLKACAAAGAALLSACATRSQETAGGQPTTGEGAAATAPPATVPTAAPKQPVTISMSTFGAPYEDRLYTDSYIPGFEAEHPEVEVQFLHPQDYVADIVRLSAAGEAPDVIRYVGTQLEWGLAGIYGPLDELMAAANFDKEDFYAATWKGASYKGLIYGVSQSPVTMTIWYNPEVFDEAGLPYPDNEYTFDRLMADAKALTKKDASGAVIRYGFEEAWNVAPAVIGSWVYCHGGRLLNEAGTETVFDSPEVIEAFANMQRFVKEGWAPSPAVGADWSWFVQGKVAMTAGGCHMASIGTSQAGPDFRFVGITWPKAQVRSCVAQDIGFGIGGGSKHQKEAFDFLAYILSKESLLEYWQKLWVALPARKSVFNDPRIKEIKGIPDFSPSLTRGNEEFNEKCQWQIDAYNMGIVHLDWASPWLAKMNPILQEAIDAVTQPANPADPETAVKTAAEKLRKVIAENPL